MSQQINLLEGSLVERQSRLRLSHVLFLGVVSMALVAIASFLAYDEQRALQAKDETLVPQLKAAQGRVQELAKVVAQRTPDPALAAEFEILSREVQRREGALRVLDGERQQAGVFADAMRGLARQTLEGVWLTSFSLGGESLEIQGRLVDSSLLPNYIKRLNGEGSFRGRRFDTLSLREVLPEARTAEEAGSAPKPRLPRYVEFALRAGVADSSGVKAQQ